MKAVLDQMLAESHLTKGRLSEIQQLDEISYENTLKEIIQQLALVGLWRGKFFEHAAFYGGTALRIFYGLRRFSEDLDFSLLKPDDKFNLTPYLNFVASELESFGFSFEVLKHQKHWKSNIDTAFVKGNTLINLIAITPNNLTLSRIPKNKTLKIKIEVDTLPPGGANYNIEHLLTPFPFSVRLFSKPDLFAGKIHAILCRTWKNRVKGRDYYDFLWYLGQQTPCHLKHLHSRIAQSNPEMNIKFLDHSKLIELLSIKFQTINFDQAKRDVVPFVPDTDELELWSLEFFLKMLKRLKSV